MSIFGLWAINLTNCCMELTLVLLKMKSFSLFGFPREPVVFHLPYPFLNLSVVKIFIFQQIWISVSFSSNQSALRFCLFSKVLFVASLRVVLKDSQV